MERKNNMDCKIIAGGVAVDDRGLLRFVNDFNFSDVKRFYQVENHCQGFIRAWHGHVREGKYVWVASGTALVAAVPMAFDDIDNSYYLRDNEVRKFILSSQSPKILFIPPGFANGFKNLTNNTIIQFFSTSSLDDSKGDDIRFDWDYVNVWEDDFR
jgi:dTDP-4-dehydrorhamnose 3,5-epimerase